MRPGGTELRRPVDTGAAAPARQVGRVLVAVGALGIAAWIWTTVRSHITSGMVSWEGGVGPALQAHLELLTVQLTPLLLGSLVLGLGVLLQLVAEHLLRPAGDPPAS